MCRREGTPRRHLRSAFLSSLRSSGNVVGSAPSCRPSIRLSAPLRDRAASVPSRGFSPIYLYYSCAVCAIECVSPRVRCGRPEVCACRLRGAVREMSEKDRSSPTLVENSLKSLLDQPSIFPLIGKCPIHTRAVRAIKPSIRSRLSYTRDVVYGAGTRNARLHGHRAFSVLRARGASLFPSVLVVAAILPSRGSAPRRTLARKSSPASARPSSPVAQRAIFTRTRVPTVLQREKPR